MMKEKHNTSKGKNIKTKIISLVTAIALWLYVIAVVDPSEKKIIENIPITITNGKELRNDGFVIYPREDMKTDITLQGKLSEIQKLNKNNIHIYGEVINPVEGQNLVNLRTNISNRISRELRENTFVVNLEKKVEKSVPIEVKIPKTLKDEVDNIKLESKEISISGPRTLVNEVKYAGGDLNTEFDEKKPVVTEKVELALYDSNNNEVNLPIEEDVIPVEVNFIVQKTVPIKLKLTDGGELSNFEISPKELLLLGNSEELKAIDSVFTEDVNPKDFEKVSEKKIKLKLPSNIKIKGDVEEITVTKK